MTFADEKGRAGKRYVVMVDLELDFCQLTYSESPCAAVLGTTGDHKCLNTFETCQDTDNYDPADKTYRFIQPLAGLPRTVDAYPLLDLDNPVEFAPTRLDPGNSLGKRASVTVRFRDAPHHDRGIDKYARERITGEAAADGSTYDPYEQGTFFGKLRARNPFYLGRKLHVYSGYIPWDHDANPNNQPAWTEQDLLDHLQKRTYVMERWEGPDTNGSFRIVAKDILKLADDDRAQAPLPSGGRLSSSITAGDGSATLTPTGIGDEEYPASGRAKLSDEIVAFTRSGDTLTLGTRGDLNTEADDHDEGDTVQLIYEQEGSKASAIVEDLLLNFANIDSAFVDPDSPSAWEAEDDTYIGRLFTGYVVEPTPVVDLINELSRQAGFFIWWDDLNQLIQFKAIRQPETVTISLTDDDAFIEGTIRQKEQPDKRRSQIWVYHGHIRPTDDIDKGKHFATVFVLTESAKEAANAYGRKAIQKIFSRWISQTNRPAAEDLAGRIMSRFQDPPRRFEFTLPGSRSEVETGDIFNATTRLIQNERGENDTRRMIALSKEDTGEGTYRIDAEEFLFVEQDDEGVKRVVVTADVNDFKARDEFDLIYASVESGDTVVFEIESGVIVGASGTSGPAWDMQDWPSGVTITVVVNGRIQGAGGDGGETPFPDNHFDGFPGGDALLTRYPITLTNNSEVWSGAGGGASALSQNSGQKAAVGMGGGAAGTVPGEAEDHSLNPDFFNVADGEDGTSESGGNGGSASVGSATAAGGDGGGPGQDGEDGSASGGDETNRAGTGGSAGAAIDGDSFVTYDTAGDIRGAQIN